MKTSPRTVLVLSALLVGAVHAQAQSSFVIDWHTIGGGGGTSTGGVFAVSGTIGQPDANSQPMTNGTFSLTGGFWSLFAVQMPDAPLLTLALTGTNTALVSWPVTALSFQLQENMDLTLTDAWAAVTQPAVTNGAQISVTVPASMGTKFFRLKSQ